MMSKQEKPSWLERFRVWFYREIEVDHGSEQLPTGGTENPWDEAIRENTGLKATLRAVDYALEAVCAARDQIVAERDEARKEVADLKSRIHALQRKLISEDTSACS